MLSYLSKISESCFPKQSQNVGFHTETSSFYSYLAGELSSGNPITEALRRIKSDLPFQHIRQATMRLAEKCETGIPLSEAMNDFPNVFPKEFLAIIEKGEREGTLVKVLGDLADLTQLSKQITRELNLLTLSFLTIIYFAILLFFIVFVILSYVIMQFKGVFVDLLEGEPLPGLTALLIDIITPIYYLFFQSGFGPVLLLAPILIGLIFIFLLFTDNSISRKFKPLLSVFVPFISTPTYNTASTNFCVSCAFFLKHGVSTVKAIQNSVSLIENSPGGDVYNRVTRFGNDLNSICAAMENEATISRLFPLTFLQTPEKELAEEMDKLSGLMRSRCELSQASSRDAWSAFFIIIGIIFFSWLAIVVFSLFMPLISILEKLGL